VFEYAVIGETINCASRLESFDKARHSTDVRVLVSSETKKATDKFFSEEIFIGWGEKEIKGLEKRISIYELKANYTNTF
jgi:adenylate cyclase